MFTFEIHMPMYLIDRYHLCMEYLSIKCMYMGVSTHNPFLSLFSVQKVTSVHGKG